MYPVSSRNFLKLVSCLLPEFQVPSCLICQLEEIAILQQFIPVIPALGENEAGDHHEFKASPGYIVNFRTA